MDQEEEESERQLQELETVALKAMSVGTGPGSVTSAFVKFARIQMALSRQAHKQTGRIIRLTWGIVLLTFVLLIFTVYLCYDAYLKNESHKKQDRQHAEQNHSPH